MKVQFGEIYDRDRIFTKNEYVIDDTPEALVALVKEVSSTYITKTKTIKAKEGEFFITNMFIKIIDTPFSISFGTIKNTKEQAWVLFYKTQNILKNQSLTKLLKTAINKI